MRRSNPPTFIREGIVTIKVSIIILRTFALLMILNSLATLKALAIVAFPPTETYVVRSIIMPTMVAITMTKSNLFQLSLK